MAHALMATIAIGDVHGNVRALDDLLARLASKILREDTLVFLGDYIDRGPESKACIARIMDLQRSASFNVVTLLGNHEQWLLQTYRDPTWHSWLLGMDGLTTIRSDSAEAADALTAAVDQLGFRIVQDRLALPYELFLDCVPTEHLKFPLSLKTYWRTADAICVHGGLDPAVGALEVHLRST